MKRGHWMGAAVFAVTGVILLLIAAWGTGEQAVILSYSDFWLLAESGQVESVTMGSGEYWQTVLIDGTAARTPNPRAADGKERLLSLDIAVREQENGLPSWTLGLIAFGALILFSKSRGKGALGLGKYAAVQANERVPDITFSDVAASGETLRRRRPTGHAAGRRRDPLPQPPQTTGPCPRRQRPAGTRPREKPAR